jgi:NADH:ubiquinone oxidoreductase subunit 3 (subunit A)
MGEIFFMRKSNFINFLIISYVMSFNLKAEVKNIKNLLEEKFKKEIKKDAYECVTGPRLKLNK